LVSPLIKISDGGYAEVGEIVTQLLDVLLVQNFSILAIGTPGHGWGF
jgi:hypothetical protein